MRRARRPAPWMHGCHRPHGGMRHPTAPACRPPRLSTSRCAAPRCPLLRTPGLNPTVPAAQPPCQPRSEAPRSASWGSWPPNPLLCSAGRRTGTMNDAEVSRSAGNGLWRGSPTGHPSGLCWGAGCGAAHSCGGDRDRRLAGDGALPWPPQSVCGPAAHRPAALLHTLCLLPCLLQHSRSTRR